MTVCVTGDVHHMGMETRDQEYLDETEVEAAIEYAEIAATYDVPVTLFCTGKCVTEEPARMRRLAGMDNVELGGHNFWAFTTPVHDAWRALEKVTKGVFGSWNGPAQFQAWEIEKTINVFADLGVNLTAWRDHAYRHDDNTVPLLAAEGITHVSNVVGPEEPTRRKSGMTVVPVNTPPDHEHVYHAFLTPEFDAERDFEGPFGTESFTIDEWRDWVVETMDDAIDRGQPATVLAHPSCMDIADDLTTFEEICAHVADGYDARRVSEVVPKT